MIENFETYDQMRQKIGHLFQVGDLAEKIDQAIAFIFNT